MAKALKQKFGVRNRKLLALLILRRQPIKVEVKVMLIVFSESEGRVCSKESNCKQKRTTTFAKRHSKTLDINSTHFLVKVETNIIRNTAIKIVSRSMSNEIMLQYENRDENSRKTRN